MANNPARAAVQKYFILNKKWKLNFLECTNYLKHWSKQTWVVVDTKDNWIRTCSAVLSKQGIRAGDLYTIWVVFLFLFQSESIL